MTEATQQAQERLDSSFGAIYRELEKDVMRPKQMKMYLCSAKCCENSEMDRGKVNRCLSLCAEPLEKAQKVAQHEFSAFENRFQRCATSCQDEANDMVNANKDGATVRKYVEKCFDKCVDVHLGLLTAMDKRIRDAIVK